MAGNKRKVSIMLSTIDEHLPISGNVHLMEMDVDVFNKFSKEQFARKVNIAAQAFWNQMKNGRLHVKSHAPKTEITEEDIEE